MGDSQHESVPEKSAGIAVMQSGQDGAEVFFHQHRQHFIAMPVEMGVHVASLL